jgi:hypothetical protein
LPPEAVALSPQFAQRNSHSAIRIPRTTERARQDELPAGSAPMSVRSTDGGVKICSAGCTPSSASRVE